MTGTCGELPMLKQGRYDRQLNLTGAAVSDRPTPVSPCLIDVSQDNRAARPRTLPELLTLWRTEPPLVSEDWLPEIIDPPITNAPRPR